MAQQLENIVSFAGVGAGLTVALDHDLQTAEGKAVTPDLIARRTTGNFTVTVTSTQVSVTNTGAAAADIDVWVRYNHTIERGYGNTSTALPIVPFELGGPADGASTTLQQAYQNGGAASYQTITVDSTHGPVRLRRDAIGAVTTSAASALELANETAAVLNTQQYSPYVLWRGAGWDTGANASRTLDYMFQIQPIQGNPMGGGLAIMSRIASGTWRNSMRIGFQTNNIGAPSPHVLFGYNDNNSGDLMTVQILRSNGVAGGFNGQSMSLVWAQDNGNAVAEGTGREINRIDVNTASAMVTSLLWDVRAAGPGWAGLSAALQGAVRLQGRTDGLWTFMIASDTTADPISGNAMFLVAKPANNGGTMRFSVTETTNGDPWCAMSNGTITGFCGYASAAATAFVYGTFTNHAVHFRTNNTLAMTIDASQNVTLPAGFLELNERVAPAAGAANTGRIYCQDNGAGKTQLMVIFNTGAAQQIAIQP